MKTLLKTCAKAHDIRHFACFFGGFIIGIRIGIYWGLMRIASGTAAAATLTAAAASTVTGGAVFPRAVEALLANTEVFVFANGFAKEFRFAFIVVASASAAAAIIAVSLFAIAARLLVSAIALLVVAAMDLIHTIFTAHLFCRLSIQLKASAFHPLYVRGGHFVIRFVSQQI